MERLKERTEPTNRFIISSNHAVTTWCPTLKVIRTVKRSPNL